MFPIVLTNQKFGVLVYIRVSPVLLGLTGDVV